MCLIIDANVVCALFDITNKKHSDFEPVLKWIIKGKGKIVYGGTKIKNEFSKCSSYLKILRLLDSYRKIVHLSDDEVDKCQTALESKIKGKKFNDSHIVAMVIVSQVKIVCTTDTKSLKYVANKDVYPEGIKRPKIYSRKSHLGLLVDSNIANICLPCGHGCKTLNEEFLDLCMS